MSLMLLINPVIDLCSAFFQNRFERITRSRTEYLTVNPRIYLQCAVTISVLLDRDHQPSVFGDMRTDFHFYKLMDADYGWIAPGLKN